MSASHVAEIGQDARQRRRRLLQRLGTAGLGLIGGNVALAATRRALVPMTDGPFYPPPAYRARQPDSDADLTTVRTGGGTAPAARARGEYLDLYGSVVDRAGRPVDRVEVEIWQCDIEGSYRHPRGAGPQVDAGFQGFGSALSDAAGGYRFRTIRPAPYPGRTPHIHVKLRHPSFGELSSQLFVAGDAGNPRDFLWRSLSPDERATVEMQLQRAPAGAPVAWFAEHPLVVGR